MTVPIIHTNAGALGRISEAVPRPHLTNRTTAKSFLLVHRIAAAYEPDQRCFGELMVQLVAASFGPSHVPVQVK
jgi:hypothetical protein